jgi:hypothetical protein
MYPLPGNGQAGTHISANIPALGQNATFLPYILIQSGKRGKLNYTIHGKIVMPEYIHTYIHFYIDTQGRIT